MPQEYCGILQPDDPLYDFLTTHVLGDILELDIPEPIYDVYAMHPAMLVCRYHERTTDTDIACKFYGNKLPSDGKPRGPDYFVPLLKREYENMQKVWELGFDKPPFRVVRPLAIDPDINYVLAEEFVIGPSLDTFFQTAFQRGDLATLYIKLEDLARFLAELHQRSHKPEQPAPLVNATGYFGKIIDQLMQKGIIDAATEDRLQQLRAAWKQSGKLEGAPSALLHGDATPINFIFGDNHEVIAIDLERLHRGDPMKDLGCVVAEIRHACMLNGKDQSTAEALIRHVYACYGDQWPQVQQNWQSFTERGRFWMGVTELRICRNDWLDSSYRQHLIEEAEQCLRL